MADFADTKEHAGFGQLLDDALVGFEHLLTGEEFHVLDEPAPVVDRVVDIQAEAQPHLVVVLAVAGRRVDAAGACLQGHVFTQENDRIPVVEGMAAVFLFQRVRFEGCNHFTGDACPLAEGVKQTGRNDQDAAAGVEGDILEFRMDGYGQVGGQRPGRGGPDDHGYRFPGQLRHRSGYVVPQGELNVDRRGFVVGVLDLGLSQRSHTGRAPVDRLLALVETAVFGEGRQLAGGDPFIEVVHGEIRVIPFSHDAQALELLTLHLHEFCRILAAQFAHFGFGDLVLFRTQILLNLQFDGQPVAVPSRDVGRFEAAHAFAFQDDILQDLVEGMADVDMTVGIGRAVMEYVFRLVLACVSHFVIESHTIPFSHNLHFFLCEIGLHGKVGNRQVQGFFIIHCQSFRS